MRRSAVVTSELVGWPTHPSHIPSANEEVRFLGASASSQPIPPRTATAAPVARPTFAARRRPPPLEALGARRLHICRRRDRLGQSLRGVALTATRREQRTAERAATLLRACSAAAADVLARRLPCPPQLAPPHLRKQQRHDGRGCS